MRKGRDEGETGGGGKRGEKEKNNKDSGHYDIASSRPPDRRPLERHTLAPILLVNSRPVVTTHLFVYFVVGSASFSSYYPKHKKNQVPVFALTLKFGKICWE